MPWVSYWLVVAVWALLALYACVFLAAFQPQLCCLSLEDHAAEHAECPICLGDIHAGEVVRRLRCGHEFHPRCVDGWLYAQTTCPTCRKDFDGPWLL